MPSIKIGEHVLDIDPAKLLNVEFIAIERATQGRLTMNALNKAMQAGSMEAITALVWVLRKRHEPQLRFDDVTFSLMDVEALDDDGNVVDTADALSDLANELTGQVNGALAPN